MPTTYLCFVWHMHQPFYKDLSSGEYKLPWTRLHALKDYYGMVQVLEEFPAIHQTFNLVPSLLVQVEEYAAGKAADPFLRCALKPAEDLSADEQAFILQYFFQANPSRMIYRYPRYAQLYEAWHAAERNVRRARRFFDAGALRDLQVLSQLAWFDEEFLTGDADVSALVAKGRDFSLQDQGLLGRKQFELLGLVLPAYQAAAARGQIEISTTPFYHPILPLICDSNIAEIAHPYVPLPARFQYPQDAKRQIESARDYMSAHMGQPPVGMWPSEGSVSDEALTIAADAGFRWIASDNGVLARTLNQPANTELTYRPYLWRQGQRQIHVLFRDHFLSDLVGFVYSRMSAHEAAGHFLDRIRENCAPILAAGRDALVPIILDGENAWEYYEESGRPFLRELYRRISQDPHIKALTVSEALARVEPEVIGHIFPGSWISANFDVWIGAEEDNRAWDYLLRARQTYDRVLESPEGAQLPDEDKRIAYEDLLIAEGSDWCWWYGPEHDSANRPEFDRLYRDHLANVYRALRLAPPDDLSRPILRVAVSEFHQPPMGPVRATIDGEVTSYFEWLGAGLYRIDARSGAMHGHRYLIHGLHYGCDGQTLYLRLDFERTATGNLAGMEVRLSFQGVSFKVELPEGRIAGEAPSGVATAFEKVLEMRVPLSALGVAAGHPVRFQLSLWQGGLPVDALPQQGWLEFSTAEPTDWPL